MRTDQRLMPGNTTVLHRTCKLARSQFLPSLCDVGSDLDAADGDANEAAAPTGPTPLMMAAASDRDPTILPYLLSRGADPYHLDRSKGMNALMVACASSQSERVIQALCEAIILNADKAHRASTESCGAGLEALSAVSLRWQRHIASCSQLMLLAFCSLLQTGWTALHYAALNRSLAAIRILLVFGANVEACTADEGRTPLALACSAQSIGKEALTLSAARALCDAGASIVVRDVHGCTPLILACMSANSGAVGYLLSLLLAHNQRVTATAAAASTTTPTTTATIAAATSIKQPAAALLDVDAREYKFGRTALGFAAMTGDHESIRRLAQAGADVNALDGGGCCPLIWAVQNGFVNAVRRLLELGADPLLASADGVTTAVTVCQRSVQREVIEPLLLAHARADGSIKVPPTSAIPKAQMKVVAHGSSFGRLANDLEIQQKLNQ